MMIAIGGRYQQHDQFVDRMKLLLGRMSQNDEIEIREKMKETTEQLENLIPLMKSYLALPEPDHPVSKQRWWMHRTRINRELEVILHNFHLLHVVLSATGYTATSNGVLRSILQGEMKKLDSSKTRFVIDEYDDMADIVAQAERTFLMLFSQYSDSHSNSNVPEIPDEYWINNNNNDEIKTDENENTVTLKLKEELPEPKTPIPTRKETQKHQMRRKSSAARKEERTHYCSLS